MKSFLHKLNLFSFSTLAICLCGEPLMAQDTSGYGASSVALIQARNSINRYTVNNVQAAVRNQAVSSVGERGVNLRNYLGSSSGSLSQRSKPFSASSRGPSVSPYLSLSAPRASASDYYSIIQPEQEREQRRQQRQALLRQRQLNQIAARAPYSTTGDETQAPTGHVAVFQSLGSFQNTGNYFPPPSQPKRR